jgi:hypothetical protein
MAGDCLRMADGLDVGAYSNTAGFSRRDWAWEFLRRNPAFREAMSGFSDRVRSQRIAPNATVYRLQSGAPSLADWGLLFRDVGG